MCFNFGFQQISQTLYFSIQFASVPDYIICYGQFINAHLLDLQAIIHLVTYMSDTQFQVSKTSANLFIVNQSSQSSNALVFS